MAPVVLVCALAAGCSSEPSEEDGALDLGESSASPESPGAGDEADEADESEAPDEGPGAIPTSYPDVGLEFDQLPQPSGGPRRAALETYVGYERGVRELGRTGEIGQLIRDSAAPPVVDGLQTTVDYLQDNDVRFRGTAVVEVSFAGTTQRSVEIETCNDGSDLGLVEGDRSRPIEGPTRTLTRFTVTDAGGAWFVTRDEPTEEAC